MASYQNPNFIKEPEKSVTPTQRIIAAILLFLVLLGFFALWGASQGWWNLGMIFGVCGFKQSTGWPCPGCGITTSMKLFVKGHLIESFYIQPAGGALCCIAIGFGVFSLLITLFGVDFGLLNKIKIETLIKWSVVIFLVILGSGWIVTLTRAWVANT